MLDLLPALSKIAPLRLRAWALWTGANLVYLFGKPGTGVLPPALEALGVGFVLLLAPALGLRAWGVWDSRRLGVGLIRDLAAAGVVLIALLSWHRLVGHVPEQSSMWNGSWLFMNIVFVTAGLCRGFPVSRRGLLRWESVLGAVLFAGSFAAFLVGATIVVPTMRDHDQEVHATGYSLATRFEPFLLTDRHTFYYFAHPPLLHLYVAGSFIYFDQLPALRFYDTASLRAYAAARGLPSPLPEGLVSDRRRGPDDFRVTGLDGSDYLLHSVKDGTVSRAQAAIVEIDGIARKYEEKPFLLETRLPNAFLGALVVALLGLWVSRISHRPWLGLAVAVAYASTPEVFVRSSYGGYYALGTLTCLLGLMAVYRLRPGVSRTVLGLVVASGVLAALADHKMVLLPVAAGCVAVWLILKSRPGRAMGYLALCGGFLTGTALFWAYGLAVNPEAFVEDHLFTHVIDRITHVNPFGYGGYPTPFGLWSEMASHTGFLLLPVAGTFLAVDSIYAVRKPESIRGESHLLWASWVLLVGIAFTLIDWRMTKHLVPILIPAFIALVTSRHVGRRRLVAATLTLLVVLFANAIGLISLIRDFGAYPISPVW